MDGRPNQSHSHTVTAPPITLPRLLSCSSKLLPPCPGLAGAVGIVMRATLHLPAHASGDVADCAHPGQKPLPQREMEVEGGSEGTVGGATAPGPGTAKSSASAGVQVAVKFIHRNMLVGGNDPSQTMLQLQKVCATIPVLVCISVLPQSASCPLVMGKYRLTAATCPAQAAWLRQATVYQHLRGAS